MGCAGLRTLAAIALFMPGPALADIDAIRGANNSLWFSGGASHIDYAEFDDDGSNIDTERGTVPTLSTGFSYLDERNVYLALEGDVSWGDLRYRGGFQDGTPYEGDTAETIWSIDWKTGFGAQIGPSALLIPYVQFGYRNWTRDLGSFTEIYRNYDWAGGLMAQYAPSSKTVLSAWGAVGQTFNGKMEASFLPEEFKLGNAVTWNVGAKAGYRVSSRFEFFTSAEFDRLGFGRSQDIPVGGGWYFYEPESRTHAYTMQIGFAYRYQ